MPSPFEIYLAKKTWNGCEDERPWIIIEVLSPDLFSCFPISGACYQGDCFYIDPSKPDAQSTKLKKPCFIHFGTFVELIPANLIKFRGKLNPPLLEEFLKDAGLDHLIP